MSQARQLDQERMAAIRSQLDALDTEILGLLNQRAALSLEVGELKAHDHTLIFKPQRERSMLERLVRENPGPLPEGHLRSIWREILSSSRALQRPQNVAYLGPEGTYSHMAAVEFLGNGAIYHPCKDINQIFEEVVSGSCELGVVPLENSLQGTVGVSFDLFYRYDVRIVAELYFRISNTLLSSAPSLADIRTVYSHPQPLAQCGIWLRTHLPGAVLIPVESTSAAAARAAGNPEAAAIGNARLAELYGLAVLAQAIEDSRGNWTRFVVIATGEAELPAAQGSGEGRKTTVLFTVSDRPGSLAAILDLLAKSGVNMRKLESRPMSGQAWRYVFIADVESDLTEAGFTDLLRELENSCTSFRVLGSYPTGPQLDRPWIAADKDGDENE